MYTRMADRLFACDTTAFFDLHNKYPKSKYNSINPTVENISINNVLLPHNYFFAKAIISNKKI